MFLLVVLSSTLRISAKVTSDKKYSHNRVKVLLDFSKNTSIQSQRDPMILGTTRSTLLRQARLISSRRSTTFRPRTFFTSSANPGPASSSIGAHDAASPTFKMLGCLVDELDKLAPRFEIDASEIKILKEPKDFYEALKVRIYIEMEE